MADVLGTIMTIADVVERLYIFGKAVKDSKGDISRLCGELSALQGILNRIQDLQDRGVVDADFEAFVSTKEFERTVADAQTFLKALFDKLRPRSHFVGKAVQALKWPFTKDDVAEQQVFLERVKSALTLGLMGDVTALSTSLLSEVHGLRSMFGRFYEENQQQVQEDRMTELRRQMSAIDVLSTHEQIRKVWEAYPNSGMWFIKHQFRFWYELAAMNDSKVLPCRAMWLKGKSGAGKSTLFSHCVEDVKVYLREHDQNEHCAAYFYCSLSDDSSQSVVQVLATLLVQLSQSHPEILEPFLDGKTINHDKLKNVTILQAAIVDASSRHSQVLLMIDAINETKEAIKLLESLNALLASSPSIRIFLTSTPDVSTSTLRSLGSGFEEIEMTPELIADDVQNYVQARLQDNPTICSMRMEKREGVQHQLTSGTDGVFRWVQLQVDQLSGMSTGRDVLEALRRLPPDLNATYTDTLRRVPHDMNRRYVRRALLWLDYAMAPLSLAALAEAIALEDGMHTLEEDDKLRQTNFLFSSLRGLINYNPSTGTVGLAHSSVRMFLQGDDIHNTDVAEFALDNALGTRNMFRKCLMYVMFQDFSSLSMGDHVSDYESFLEAHPLYHYAATRWAMHAATRRFRYFSLNDKDLALIFRFFATSKLPDGGNFAFWVQHIMPDADYQTVLNSEPLYYAASYGMTPVVQQLLTSGSVGPSGSNAPQSIDKPGGRAGSTALEVACYRGHIGIVNMLLEHGANPNIPNAHGETTMFWAKLNGWDDVAELLQSHGGRSMSVVASARHNRLPYQPSKLSEAERSELWVDPATFSKPNRDAAGAVGGAAASG